MPVDPRFGAVAVGTGDPLAQITQQLADLRRRLDSLERGRGFIALVRVMTTGTQTLTTGVLTAVTFGSEQFDTANMWVSGSPTRLTIPAAGAYLVTAKALFQANATGQRRAAIRRNGSESFATIGVNATGGSELTELSCSDTIRCDIGDYLELTMTQSSGGNLDVFNPTALSAIYLGAV
jgi:hypothetical protein